MRRTIKDGSMTRYNNVFKTYSIHSLFSNATLAQYTTMKSSSNNSNAIRNILPRFQSHVECTVPCT
jgi:serine protease inhibitor